MAKLIVLCVFMIVALCATTVHAGIFGECPPSGQHNQCAPKCLTDNDCSQTSGKCCPNICNYKSCVIPKAGNSGSNSGYKGSSASGSYCGNVKCSPFEKCDLDRATKRMKCVRS